MYLLFLFFVLIVLPCGAQTDWEPVTAAEGTERIECRIIAPLGEDENAKRMLGEITEDDWVLGDASAPLTIIEYADFQCPYCAPTGMELIETQRKFPDRIRYVYRHFPLSFHEYARITAYAADAAGKQGLFFDAAYYLYQQRSQWVSLPSEEAVDEWLREEFAASLEGLDRALWVRDYESQDIRDGIGQEYQKAARTGLISGTPSLFFNYNNYSGSGSEEVYLKYAKFFEMQGHLYADCPYRLVDDAHEYRAIIETDKGTLTAELFTDMPDAVSSFITLAVDGWYDNLTFHRVIPGYVAQVGDPSGIGIGNAGYYFDNEVSDSHKYGEPGLLGVANAGPYNNSAQFFIADDLNRYYAENLAKYYPDMTPEEINEKAAQNLAQMTENYPIFGKLSEDSIPLIGSIDQQTVVRKIRIEKREKK